LFVLPVALNASFEPIAGPKFTRSTLDVRCSGLPQHDVPRAV